MVPENTVYLIHNLWFNHSSIQTTLRYIFFNIIYSTCYLRTGTRQGCRPHHPSSVNNQKYRIDIPPSIAQYRGYLWKAMEPTGHRSYIGQYGTYFRGTQPGYPFLSPDQSAMVGTAPHDATATAPIDAAPSGTIPWDSQHPRQPGLQACPGHPGSTDWHIRHNDTDG